MKKIKLIALLFVIIGFEANAQYTTDYPFDSLWVSTFNGTIYNILDFGAIPDDTINDSEAFRLAADAIETNGGGKLVIPNGIFIVGEQILDSSSNNPYYQYQEIFRVDNVNQLIIEGGDSTIIKVADNLAFGAFDPVTGIAVYDSSVTNNPIYRADAEIMFDIGISNNVFIHNLELDGNISGLNVGGYWGHDSSRQCEAEGLFLASCSNVLIRDVNTHHHGLDGLIIEGNCQNNNCPPTIHVIENVISEYNSRQGLSWVGGKGLTAYNCKFNHTSKARFTSNPGAGVDIEAGGNLKCRGGKFINCEFNDNFGSGMICDSPNGINGYTTFENCLFAGNEDNSIWPGAPKLKFYNCSFYGIVPVGYGDANPVLANYFNNCLFEDIDYGGNGLDNGEYLMFMWTPGENITFDSCQWIANERKAFKVTNDTGDFYFNDCTIINKNTNLQNGGKQCSIETSVLNNVKFIDDYPTGFSNS